ncbi:class I SAM-dependent methyltransferase [Paractinoplanes atraurantiacus]|uniref:Methyltransferase domain-containing protein n=1 Tax=Paractinoplanes atraurantiacus TaxID=1036182 RepID=A0A285I558_9ACTN|nr:class I SAM-dependent methyltransferase [Actinoplanes atraurantiacus]SNY42206.1 Methyltransferase domain-containing protein [Actinoplanes atraurantiacus]
MSVRERRTVFGEAAGEYDRVRPGYPRQLADDLLASSAPGPVLEVGAGTGKATVLFARPGVDLTCVEPDARMARLLRRNVPGVTVVESSLEDWQPDKQYGLVFSAQAWHWVDPARRADLALGALAPGGVFAPFWNLFLVADPALHAALAEVDARHGLTDDTSHRFLAADGAMRDEFEQELPAAGLTDERFTGLEIRRYERTLTYDAQTYRDYLSTISMYRILDPDAAEAALADTASVIGEHGGSIAFQVVTDVAIVRKR